MDAQIEGFLLQLTTTCQDLPGVAGRLSPQQFNWQPAPGRWSIGQCVEHLNLTTERYLPVLRGGIADARRAGRLGSGPFPLGLFERVFLGIMEPPARLTSKAPSAFVAPPNLDASATLERWVRLNEELGACIRSAEGVDLRRVKIRSQFGPVSFSLAGTLTILLAHQRRHIWQAREVRKAPEFPRE